MPDRTGSYAPPLARENLMTHNFDAKPGAACLAAHAYTTHVACACVCVCTTYTTCTTYTRHGPTQ